MMLVLLSMGGWGMVYGSDLDKYLDVGGAGWISGR